MRKPEAYEEIKAEEDRKFQALREQQEQDIKSIREEVKKQIAELVIRLKPEVISKGYRNMKSYLIVFSMFNAF